MFMPCPNWVDIIQQWPTLHLWEGVPVVISSLACSIKKKSLRYYEKYPMFKCFQLIKKFKPVRAKYFCRWLPLCNICFKNAGCHMDYLVTEDQE